MQEVAQATMTYEHFPEVMTMLWKRMLQDNRKNWRRTYKVSFFFYFSCIRKFCYLISGSRLYTSSLVHQYEQVVVSSV